MLGLESGVSCLAFCWLPDVDTAVMKHLLFCLLYWTPPKDFTRKIRSDQHAVYWQFGRRGFVSEFASPYTGCCPASLLCFSIRKALLPSPRLLLAAPPSCSLTALVFSLQNAMCLPSTFFLLKSSRKV